MTSASSHANAVAGEFRLDTFTNPTASVLAAATAFAADTTLGDAVYNEDQATLALEAKVAALTNKPAALFCVLGTMLNQIALRAHLHQPPHLVLCDFRAHVYTSEAGGLATLSQAMVTPVHPANGTYITLEDIAANYTPDDGDIHSAPTRVVLLENTCNGVVTPLAEVQRISRWCRDHDIRLHCDGARLWNASVATGVLMAEWCAPFDLVLLCLLKLLGAPIGLVLVGEPALIRKANHFKKQNGGGIRQLGLLANMAAAAIDENFPQLAELHRHAAEMAAWCEQHGIPLLYPVQLSFVFIDAAKAQMLPAVLVECGRKHGVRLMGPRIAYHFQNTDAACEALQQAVLEAFQEAKAHPHVADGPLQMYPPVK